MISNSGVCHETIAMPHRLPNDLLERFGQSSPGWPKSRQREAAHRWLEGLLWSWGGSGLCGLLLLLGLLEKLVLELVLLRNLGLAERAAFRQPLFEHLHDRALKRRGRHLDLGRHIFRQPGNQH